MTYYIHVNEDGTETRFEEKPVHLPVYEVRPEGKHRETTRTHLVYMVEDCCGHQPRMIKPRGDGWKFKGIDENSATWQRRVYRGAATLLKKHRI
jgi:hypothetical protein